MAEAKLRMTYDEFLDWNEYVKTRGTMNLGLRLEFLFARLSLQVARATGGKAEFKDFLRFHEAHSQQGHADIADIAKALGVREVKRNG